MDKNFMYGWIIQTGNQGAPRDRNNSCVPTVLYGLYACHSQYTSFAPRFLSGKTMLSFSGSASDAGDYPKGVRTFQAVFYASAFFQLDGFAIPTASG
jgi:hypothetical protein